MSGRIKGLRPVLAARDVAESIRFYGRLGFSETFRDRPVEPVYAVVEREGVELHLQWADAGQWSEGLDRPVYRFLVEDVDALFEEFAAAAVFDRTQGGGGPWGTPRETPWGTKEFHLRDPADNGLQFYEPRLAPG
ncbi:MAG: hypothetical protein SFX72_15420 [Isosphaeraceae bacterium]|nr:hypothetical protein [Isosphaeraceae bacterium]